jgi:hypothetical protein
MASQYKLIDQRCQFDSAWPKVYCAAALVSLLTVCSGCGSHSKGPTTYPVTGRVTLEGQPVLGADVAFVPPKDATGTAPAQAVTDRDGHYEVMSIFDQGRVDQPGMTPGKYTVQITQLEKLRGGEMSKTPKNLLPKKYESAASGLAAEVVAGGENVFNFDLKKH